MEEKVTVTGPSIENTCEKCYNAAHWKLRRKMYCAKYDKKPYDVYFEGAPCPYFDETPGLPGSPSRPES